MNFFHARSRTITSAAFVLAFAALLSRILGLLRDRILAGKFGAGDELDIYFAAFRVPDLLYNVIIAGAVSSAFIPVFITLYYKNKQEAWEAASNFLNIALILLILCAVLFAVASPFIMPLLAPGFDSAKLDATTNVARIMFVSPIFLGLSAILSGVLHSFKRFFAYALAPIFYNVGIIFGALVLTEFWGIYGLAWGVVLGAFLHFLIQIPSAVFSGFVWRGVFNLKDKNFSRIFTLMVPRSLGLAAFQINLWVITAIASMLAAGSVAIFNLANNLQYLPIGIIGISFATAAFPSLSKSASAEKREKFIDELYKTMRLILFFVFPLSVFMFVLRAHIVRIVLGTGQFSWTDTRLTAAALGIFCFGIFAHSLIPLISRAFYSLGDTKTPVIINTLAIFINVLLSFVFVFWLFEMKGFLKFVSDLLNLEGINNIEILGLPLAFAIAGIANLKILFYVFCKKIGRDKRRELYFAAQKIFVASVIAGLTAYGALYAMDSFLDTHTVFGLFTQAGISSATGIAMYILFMLIFHSPELSLLLKFSRSKLSPYPREHYLNGR